eukprot:CAMPEP_0170539320 /NCGR_PEP_ID=MMETSP0209-20121228/103841_1 /TAXON_ID=665100 ORGANISM="Litonotus pictus, Strain P1" /NCGR_SAMPLE_ID=MMETSP0209 /ASSEMBLY_ACC=CAM_ASM_000301 /LENGTH=507 /DNA_ID=CAMNT_0010841209 /DNA_START=22 /DNA_END=1546 /DNA_ORIENTATION=-
MTSIFFNSNPFDEIDNQIKFNFTKKYGLCLNKLNYSTFGIIDDCFLVSLIGESPLFHVYLGYKYGLFYSVKVMKRSKYESKQILNQRIELFEKEMELRLRLTRQEQGQNIIPIKSINYSKYIIYESYCVNGTLNFYAECSMSEKLIRTIFLNVMHTLRNIKNGTLNFYAECSMSEKLIRTIFLNVMHTLRNINEGSRMYHTGISMEDVAFDENFNMFILGVRDFSYSVFSSSIHYNNLSVVNEEEMAQVNLLIVLLCRMLFKEDVKQLLPFIFSNIKTTNLKERQDLQKPLQSQQEQHSLSKLNSDLLGKKHEQDRAEGLPKEIKEEKELPEKKLLAISQVSDSNQKEIEKQSNDIEILDLDLSESLGYPNYTKCNFEENEDLNKIQTLNNNTSLNNNFNSQQNFILTQNMEYLNSVLCELINKYSFISSIIEKESLIEFIKKLIREKTLEDLEFCSWYNGDILDACEYYHEMNNLRVRALKKNYSVLSEREEALLKKKRGIFKVIK